MSIDAEEEFHKFTMQEMINRPYIPIKKQECTHSTATYCPNVDIETIRFKPGGIMRRKT